MFPLRYRWRVPNLRVSGRLGVATALIVLAVAAPASAQSGSGSGLKVTVAARQCDRYTDIFANRARNDIMESLKDLGPDTPYVAGEAISPTKEDLSPQSRCRPLPNWTFTLGSGYRTRAVSGVWGSLSIVTSPFSSPAIVTQATTPLLDNAGRPTGDTIAGATTVELTQTQANLAAQANRLWLQGGTPTDPILFQQYPNEYGFGALRCAIDNLNGDNVEWISYPSGAKHVFCYAYYVKPPPTSGTIIVRKEVDAPSGTARTDFRFTGNISFNADQSFSLAAAPGAPASTTFYRAEVTGLTPDWTFAETVPTGWTLTSISCVSATGASTSTTNVAAASTSVRLGAGDTVTCTYADRLTPPPAGLAISKVTSGGVGSFSWDVTPAGGGAADHVSATTTKEDVPTLGAPLLTLDPGAYAIRESLPRSAGGSWRLERAQCNGAAVEQTQPVNVTLTAGQGAFCTFFNHFTPNGTIRLRKRTVGALGTVGFVITPVAEKTRSYEQSATTTSENEPVLAKGDDTSALALGRYVIQETTPSEPSSGFWAIDSVTCNGVPVGSGQGLIVVTLTAARAGRGLHVHEPLHEGPGAAGAGARAGARARRGRLALVAPRRGPRADQACDPGLRPAREAGGLRRDAQEPRPGHGAERHRRRGRAAIHAAAGGPVEQGLVPHRAPGRLPRGIRQEG